MQGRNSQVTGRIKRVAALGILILVFSTLLVPGAQATSESKRLSETRRQLRAARSQLAQLRRNDAELQATIASVSRQLRRAQSSLASARATLAGLNARVRSTERRLAKLSADRALREKKIALRASTLYMMGPGMEAEALMGADTLNEYVEKSTALEFILRFDRTSIQDLDRIQDQQRKARKQLNKQIAATKIWEGRVYDRTDVVGEALDTHRVAEDALSKRIDDFRREVRALEAEQARIIDIIMSRSSFGGRVSLKGFAWPVGGRHITSPYGRRWGGFHTGMDIDCRTGDSIWAAKAGKVIAAEYGGGYGRMVIIDHGGGVSSLYAHNSRLYVNEGRSVKRGQRISACGSTGNSTGDHLHFEIRVNGNHRNPRPYLP
jgi:murein DD-endopeptidase MepM/ murein hydrolase activator NlpD